MDLLNRRISLSIQRAALFALFFLGISVSSSAPTTFIYYVVDPITADNPLTLYSQADGNSITAGVNLYTLNKGETATIAA
ncbi:MAG: hypothetical protein OEX83_08840, partial [Gammaproteobacteria bacterium]|nr:hypothetical protein [Gammaproteobacteria bacterium]